MIVSFKSQTATISAYLLLKSGTSANSVALWDTTTAIMFGISAAQSAGGAGTSIAVAIGGCAKLTAGASVSSGALITGTTTGLGIEDASLGFFTTATTSAPFSIGISLDAASTNSTFEVLIMPRTARWAK